MRKNRKISVIISVVMALLMALSASFVSYAKTVDDNSAQPYYVNIKSPYAAITKSGITVIATAKLVAQKSMQLKIVMELQKKKSDRYETIKTWSASKTGTRLAMSEKRNINILCDYRLKVTFTAGNETSVVYRYLS